MAGNRNLAKAKDIKNDEFYTQLSDIEDELRHYRRHFRDKTVLCNCDDPFESNFFKYFALNFNRLGLKKLVATCYSGSPIAGTQLSLFGDATEEERRTPYKAVVTSVHDATGSGGIEMEDVAELFRNGENSIDRLDGNGSYDSAECLELLDEADIVVTNPPFSLFREYITTLLEHGKKFIVMGNKNALKYKETFPLIRDGLLWPGATTLNGGRWMIIPRGVEVKSTKSKVNERGETILNVPGVMWFTNLDIKKRHEEIVLFRRYDPGRYPSYTNFDGIDVAKATDIPCDYSGNMGVPISFMDHFSPDQFEIVGLGEGDLAKEIGVQRNHRGRSDLEIVDENGAFKRPYARIVIRNLNPEQPKEL